MIIRIDKSGQQVKRIARPSSDDSYDLTRYRSCARWGDDFIVIGDKPGVYTILRLRNDGSLIWQKEINLGHGATSGHTPRIMSNGDLIFEGIDSIARIDANGDLLAQSDTNIDPGCRDLIYGDQSDRIRFVCYTNTQGRNAEIIELSQDLQTSTSTPFIIPNNVGVTKAYELADRSLLIFGCTVSKNSISVPTVLLFSQEGALIAKHEFGKQGEAWCITDGIPTEEPGSYVLIRPTAAPDTRTKMTFLSRK